MATNSNKRRWLGPAIAVGLVLLVLAIPYFIILIPEVASHRKYSDLIRQARDERIIPAATWVQAFRAERGRLPTDDEMRTYFTERFHSHAAIIRERPYWLDGWGVKGTDFIIATSVPEWNLYYCSWDRQTLEYWTD
jgi:hypothetical protein